MGARGDEDEGREGAARENARDDASEPPLPLPSATFGRVTFERAEDGRGSAAT